MKSRILALTALAVFAVTVLAGCGAAPRYWYNGQKDAMSAKKDLFECEEQAAAYSRDMGKAGDDDVVATRKSQCMELRGYVAVKKDELPKDAYKIQ